MSEWRPWFAWRPVRLLTYQVAWLRWVERRDQPDGTIFANAFDDEVERARINAVWARMKAG